MRFIGPFRLAIGIVTALTLATPAMAGVPTASLPIDDEEPATPLPPASAQPGNALPPFPSVQPGNATSASTPRAPVTPTPQSAGAAPTAVPTPPEHTESVSAMPSALVPSSTMPTTGIARLSLQVKTPGSSVYVFAHRDDPDDLANESAILNCATTCSADLPLGDYSIRVVTAEGAVSHAELELQSARWITVSPANQPVRDIGFATGLVGSVATILGVALLAEAICDSCTSAARDAGAAVALGLGIPMTAVGWSLYVVQRKASIEERILTQASRETALPRGVVLGAVVHF